MISITSLASEYKAERFDSEGFDITGEELRANVERAIRRQLGVYVRIVTSLGGDEEHCHYIFRGELRAALHGIRVAERDLEGVAAMRSGRAA